MQMTWKMLSKEYIDWPKMVYISGVFFIRLYTTKSAARFIFFTCTNYIDART